jgi:hypothetical protein
MGLQGETADAIAGLKRVVQEAFPSEEDSRLCISTHDGYLTREPQWLISADWPDPLQSKAFGMLLEALLLWFAERERL